ncbi:hypothetical protein BGX28_010264, partial [Mortierella sp. GBA30]
MQQTLKDNVVTYFKNRSRNGGGIIKDYLQADASKASILVNNNDYLGLVDSKYILTRQIDYLKSRTDKWCFSPMLLEFDSLHAKLERDLGQYYGKECVLAQSGYAANSGLMHAICTPGMHVYVDKYTHASFLEGLRSVGTNVHVCPHNDTASMESQITKYGSGLIIIESLYSNSGSFCPITTILELKHKYGCVLVVDESHSLGIYGKHGYLHMLGIDKEVDFITASLAKAFCTRAGIILGGNAVFIKENSWSYVFSSSLTGEEVVRIESTLEVIKGADDRREKLMVASHSLREGLARVTDVVKTHIPSPIICLDFDCEEKAAALHRYLASKGIVAAPFIWPARPRKRPTLRITVHSGVTSLDVTAIIAAVSSYKRSS